MFSLVVFSLISAACALHQQSNHVLIPSRYDIIETGKFLLVERYDKFINITEHKSFYADTNLTIGKLDFYSHYFN